MICFMLRYQRRMGLLHDVWKQAHRYGIRTRHTPQHRIQQSETPDTNSAVMGTGTTYTVAGIYGLPIQLNGVQAITVIHNL